MARKKHLVVLFLTLAGMALLPGTARPAADNVPAAAMALYEGPDRDQRLLAAAQKEGSVMFYTSLTAPDLKAISASFAKKYGIKVNSWRGSASDVVQRILTEAAAGRFDFDTVHVATPELEALHREKVLQAVQSPHFKDLMTAILPLHREWAVTWLSLYAQAYNTTKVKKEELPKVYRDLLDPRWKGRLGIEATTNEWFSSMVREMGEEKGLKFFRDLIAINRPSQRIGHSVLNNLVVAGEVPFALNVYHFTTAVAKQQGAPVDWLALDPTFAIAYGVGLSKRPPRPAAALLLYEYMITDVQKIMIETQQRIPGNRKYDSPFKHLKFKVLDPVLSIDEQDKSAKLYESVLAGR